MATVRFPTNPNDVAQEGRKDRVFRHQGIFCHPNISGTRAAWARRTIEEFAGWADCPVPAVPVRVRVK
jgi:hypothetical protein